MKIRYIKSYLAGHRDNTISDWTEIQAINYMGENIALNKPVTGSFTPSWGDFSRVTDGVTTGNNSVGVKSGESHWVRVDLGGIYNIDYIHIWHYNAGSRIFNGVKIEVSEDELSWFTVFDGAEEGTYSETTEGKIIKLRKDIDKLGTDASLKDINNKIIDIENSLQTTKNNFKNALISKGVDCNNINKMSNLIEKLKQLKQGVSVSINDETVDFDFDLKLINKWLVNVDLPYYFLYGSSIIYNNEIHILGGGGSGTTNHYKWNGSSWTLVSTLPFKFYRGSAVVYNNEIHILGGYTSSRDHYKWNGSSWTSIDRLPVNFYDGSAVVYNNEIHILGGNSSSGNHYKWNGSSWTSVSTLPQGFLFIYGSLVLLNNEIHILGGGVGETSVSTKYHYKWNGSSWTSVSTLPFNFYRGSAVVYNNEIHILGSYSSSRYHYKWNGSSWTSVSRLPFNFYDGSAVVYNNEIHILGGNSNNNTIDYTKYCSYGNYYILIRS